MSTQTGKARVPCSFCKKNVTHNPKIKEAGTHLGNGGTLGKNIMEYEYGMKGTAEDHPLSNAVGPDAPYKTAHAHHLIPSQIMSKSTWPEICKNYGYDINNSHNGLFLPSDLRIACQEYIPCHRSNHKYAKNGGGPTYVNSVKSMLDPIKQLADAGDYCNAEEQIIADLNEVSEDVCINIILFVYPLHNNGNDFNTGGPGCAGRVKSLGEKKKSCTRIHGITIPGEYFIEQ
jgi:hypothetical protein